MVKIPLEKALQLVISGLQGQEPVDDLARRYGVSKATYYAMRRKFLKGGIEGLKNYGEPGKPDYVKALERRVKELERELSKKSMEAEMLRRHHHF